MNELLLFVTALLCALLVTVGWRFGKERLYGVIIVFLILIATVGGKIAPFFGHETNTGNIFYASVYLATYFLIERFGKREGIFSIWVGVVAVLFFSVFVQLTILLAGSPSTASMNTALATAFGPVSQVALASVVAYAFSQNLNVRLYLYFKNRFRNRYMWLRANLSNALAQILDSAIFFTVAFWGALPPADMWDIILTGFVIKVVYMMLVSPLLYLNTIEEEEDGSGSVTVTLK